MVKDKSVATYEESYTSPDAVCAKDATYSSRDRCVIDLEDIKNEKQTYGYIEKNHKDSENKSRSFRHSRAVVSRSFHNTKF